MLYEKLFEVGPNHSLCAPQINMQQPNKAPQLMLLTPVAQGLREGEGHL